MQRMQMLGNHVDPCHCVQSDALYTSTVLALLWDNKAANCSNMNSRIIMQYVIESVVCIDLQVKISYGELEA